VETSPNPSLKAGIHMETGEPKAAQMEAHDPYAVAALTQRTPGFGFAGFGESILHRELRYATILSRLGAAIVDGLATSLAILFILIALGIVDHLTGGSPVESGSPGSRAISLLIFLIAMFAFLWLYYVGQEISAAQATLGKRLLGIKVANASGGRIGVVQSTIRFMTKMVPGINPILGLASLIADICCLAANSSTNRTLHDVVAGTVVIVG
jgi:uncharacterized RDD family membrane protein YckC